MKIYNFKDIQTKQIKTKRYKNENDFIGDLHIAQQVEIEVTKLIANKNVVKFEQAPDKKCNWDIKLLKKDGSIDILEYKMDCRAAETSNLCIPFKNAKGEFEDFLPHVTYVVFVIVDPNLVNSVKKILVMDAKLLREHVLRNVNVEQEITDKKKFYIGKGDYPKKRFLLMFNVFNKYTGEINPEYKNIVKGYRKYEEEKLIKIVI